MELDHLTLDPHLDHRSKVPAAWWAKELGQRQRKNPDRFSVRSLARWRKAGVGPPYVRPLIEEFVTTGKDGRPRRCKKTSRNSTAYCHPDNCPEAKAWKVRYLTMGKP